MPNTLTYPRGFQRYLSEDDGNLTNLSNQQVPGDRELETLYRLCVYRQANVDGWTYRERVLQTALRLFGNFSAWVLLQERNPYLYGTNYDFLQDTYQFIRTGQRNCSTFSWIEIMDEQPPANPGRRAHLRNLDLGKLLPDTAAGLTHEVLAKWCSQPDGFEDMLFSLHVLFGIAIVAPRPWEHPPT